MLALVKPCRDAISRSAGISEMKASMGNDLSRVLSIEAPIPSAASLARAGFTLDRTQAGGEWGSPDYGQKVVSLLRNNFHKLATPLKMNLTILRPSHPPFRSTEERPDRRLGYRLTGVILMDPDASARLLHTSQ
jgi:hypothetical protein